MKDENVPGVFSARTKHLLTGAVEVVLILRASNEGLLRPRVARAQKIIGLHPLLWSASKKATGPLLFHPSKLAR